MGNKKILKGFADIETPMYLDRTFDLNLFFILKKIYNFSRHEYKCTLYIFSNSNCNVKHNLKE